MNIDGMEIGPELAQLMERLGISEDMDPQDLRKITDNMENLKDSMSPELMEKITQQCQTALGLDDMDRADYEFLLMCYEQMILKDPEKVLNVSEGALYLITEKAWSDAQATAGADLDETSFKMAFLGGMVFGNEMANQRNGG